MLKLYNVMGTSLTFAFLLSSFIVMTQEASMQGCAHVPGICCPDFRR